MKKLCLTFLAILALTHISFAQWTNGLGFVYTINPVGINITTLPNAALQINGNAILGGLNISPGTVTSFPFLTNSKQMLIGWNRSGGGGETDFIANKGTGSLGGFSFYNHTNTNIDSLLMNISGTGNVGIGVAPTTSFKLNVNGTIHSKQVNVDLNGFSDFVFGPNYRLPTLVELKTYIAVNHHLPDIPSEQKVIAGGLNLGEMDKLLTQKVEELTLYLIENDKQLQEQKETNTKQQNQIDAQNDQLKLQQQQIDELKKELQIVLKSTSGK
jgi:hypothetical protein